MLETLNCWAIANKPLVSLGTALLPIILTIFAIYIAYQQYQTNRRKLKLDLFDKRFRVFQSTKDFIQGVINGASYSEENQNLFHLNTRGAQFVFGSDIQDYLDEVWSKFVDLEVLKNESSISERARESGELKKWFLVQLKTIDSKFESYMVLRH